MVEMALLDEEGLFASTHELTLDRPAYTVETLEHFRSADAGGRAPPADRQRLLRRSAPLAALAGDPAAGARGGPGAAGVGVRSVAPAPGGWPSWRGADRVVLLHQPPVDVSVDPAAGAVRAGERPLRRRGLPDQWYDTCKSTTSTHERQNPRPIPASDTASRVREAVAAAEDRKAIELKVLHLQKISDFTDYFLICSGTQRAPGPGDRRRGAGEDARGARSAPSTSRATTAPSGSSSTTATSSSTSSRRSRGGSTRWSASGAMRPT